MNQVSLWQAAAGCDSHVRLDHRTDATGHLGVRIICRGLDDHVGAPVTDIGYHSDNSAPGTTSDPGLDSLADRVFSRPVFAGEACAHDGYGRRTDCVPFIECAPLEHRYFQRSEIIFAYGAVSGDDFSLYGSRCFAFC